MTQLSPMMFNLLSGVAVTAIVGVSRSAAMAQMPPAAIGFDSQTLAHLAADLAYPTSAQRFLEAGNEQFEQEIQQLIEADNEQPSEPLLKVKPEVLKQFED